MCVSYICLSDSLRVVDKAWDVCSLLLAVLVLMDASGFIPFGDLSEFVVDVLRCP